MKKYLFPAFVFGCLAASAQPKYDYNWFLATEPSPDTAYGMSRIDFNYAPSFLSRVENAVIDVDFANASWSDAGGDFKYFTNGCIIVNSNMSIMENGDSINPGIVHNVSCEHGGYPVSQGLLILPNVTDDSYQYIFHLKRENVAGLPTSLPVVNLLYTMIDNNGDGGLGMVVEKNKLLVEDTFASGFLTAVKHADGERWWVVMPEHATNGYYIVLLDGDGPQLHRKQLIGTMQDARDWAGQAVFSPDGRFYARADGYSGLEVMEFDRCHGAFFNPRHVALPFEEGALLGAAISPNSRYLYVSSQVVLLQYDLLAPDLAASVDTVGVYDGFESWLPATFFMMQLGPDGKVYMTTSNGTNVLHVIQQPDEPGAACQFEQHAVTLPTYYSFSPPNFPNYRLGPAPENYCDSVTAVVGPLLPEAAAVKIFPNPASGQVSVEVLQECHSCEVNFFSAFGQKMASSTSLAGQNQWQFDISAWRPGVYFVVVSDGDRAFQEKLVVY